MYKLLYAVMLLILATMTANLAMSSSTPPPPKSATEVCAENYETSSANSTCWNEAFNDANYGDCRISANCSESEISNVYSTITLNPDDASSVQNCSGRLKLSC